MYVLNGSVAGIYWITPDFIRNLHVQSLPSQYMDLEKKYFQNNSIYNVHCIALCHDLQYLILHTVKHQIFAST